MKSPLYADHHATTPLRPEALDAMLGALRDLPGNPSSVHAAGRAARQAVEDARESVAEVLGARPEEIVFTSGGTEADNLAVKGGARAAREGDARRSRVAVSATEHPAVREAARALTSEGFSLTEIGVDANGLPREAEAASAPGDDLALLSVLLANNETGVMNDGLPSLARAARDKGALVHTDAVQAVGKVAVDVRALDVDLLSLTAHKFGGPRGAGALYVRRGTRLVPLVSGGGQERGRRPGTEDVAAVVGLSAALRAATGRLEAEGRRLAALRDRFEAGLLAACPLVRFNATGPGARRLPTVSSVVFPGVSGETALAALDLAGVAVSAGSACTAGTTTPSRVLLATGLSPEAARSTLRFSFGWSTTEEEVDRLLALVPGVVDRVRAATVPA